MDVNAPYSQCDAKGRCIRHPSIQMSRRKKLGGGWKKLLSLCPMCAMELMQSDGGNDVGSGGRVSADAYCGDVASLGPGDRHHRQPPSRSHRRSSQHGDDRSVDRTVMSAPSTYGYDRRRPPSRHAVKKCGSSGSGDGSDSSCDTTVDMNMSYSSQESRSRGMRREDSSLSSGSGSGHGRRRSQRPQVGHHDSNANTIAQNEEQFVCGMEYDGMYYTGQIHVESRLPHGLGTLRSDVDGGVMEGQWHFGRLVQDSRAPPQQYDQGYDQGYDQQQECQGEKYGDYCHPCTSASNSNSQQDELCSSMQRLRIPQDHSSVAETIDDSENSWSRSSSYSQGSQGSSYSARESKGALPPSGSRVSQNKIQEYAQYVRDCDESGDWYTDDDSGISGLSSGNSSLRDSCSANSYSVQGQGVAGGEYDRPRRVRFREDP